MVNMNIIEIRSDKIYKKIMDAPINKKEDIYRYELMKPFEFKWKCMNVPIVARQKGGYDVIIASEMLGVLSPKDIDEKQKKNINVLSADKIWGTCKETIE
ncbi:Zn-dependent protease, partial [Clostridioides difficile]|nr:Zn-dependent protease [Clostridioides difficile]